MPPPLRCVQPAQSSPCVPPLPSPEERRGVGMGQAAPRCRRSNKGGEAAPLPAGAAPWPSGGGRHGGAAVGRGGFATSNPEGFEQETAQARGGWESRHPVTARQQRPLPRGSPGGGSCERHRKNQSFSFSFGLILSFAVRRKRGGAELRRSWQLGAARGAPAAGTPAVTFVTHGAPQPPWWAGG